MDTPTKSRHEAARIAARARWGPPRIIRLSELTDDQRRAILTYLEVAKSAEKAAPTGENVGAATAEVQRGSAERSAA